MPETLQDHIKNGDTVNVYFENTPCLFSAYVLYIPVQADDVFIVRTQDGEVHHVKNYSRISTITE